MEEFDGNQFSQHPLTREYSLKAVHTSTISIEHGALDAHHGD